MKLIHAVLHQQRDEDFFSSAIYMPFLYVIRHKALLKCIHNKCIMKKACGQRWNHSWKWYVNILISLSIQMEMNSDMFYWQQIITISVFAMSDIFLSLVDVRGCCNSSQTKWAPASGKPYSIWSPCRGSSLCNFTLTQLPWQPGWCKTKPHVDSFLLIKPATHLHQRAFPHQLTIFTV